MVIWLWDAHGPDCAWQGVTHEHASALKQAEACITSGAASGARVELARLVTSFQALTSEYIRSGLGWTAQHREGVVTWVPLARLSS